MATEAPKIAPFSGERISYPAYRCRILDFASSLQNELDENGLLGDILPLAEFEEILEAQQDPQPDPSTGIVPKLTGYFVKLSDPGERPVRQSGQTGAVFTADELAPWQYNLDRFEKQAKARKELKTAMLASLDANTLAALTDPDYGTRKVTAADVLACLDRRFGDATVVDLHANRAKLRVPFRATDDFEKFIYTHRDAHTYARRCKQEIGEAEKVALFTDAITPCGLFERKLFLFSDINPDVHQQTFVNLAAMMLHEWRSHTSKLPSSALKNPAVAANAAATINSSDEHAELLAFRAAAASGKAPPPPPPPAGKPKKPKMTAAEYAARNVHYCWTHGPQCGHKSDECKSPGAGHRTEATDTNRLGGLEVKKVWVPRGTK